MFVLSVLLVVVGIGGIIIRLGFAVNFQLSIIVRSTSLI